MDANFMLRCYVLVLVGMFAYVFATQGQTQASIYLDDVVVEDEASFDGLEEDIDLEEDAGVDLLEIEGSAEELAVEIIEMHMNMTQTVPESGTFSLEPSYETK